MLHTPDLEAVKVWSGNLAKTATHGIVFARLIDGIGKDHGIHMFFTPLRSPNNMKTYSGILIGDMGAKIGLNGLDNG